MISRIRIFGRLVFENQRESPRWQTPPIVWAKNFWVCESKIEFVFEKISRFEIQCSTGLHFQSSELTHTFDYPVDSMCMIKVVFKPSLRIRSVEHPIRHLYKRYVQTCDATRTQYSTTGDVMSRETHERFCSQQDSKTIQCPIRIRCPISNFQFDVHSVSYRYRIGSVRFL